MIKFVAIIILCRSCRSLPIFWCMLASCLFSSLGIACAVFDEMVVSIVAR